MHVDHPTEIASRLNEQRKVRPTSAHAYDPVRAWALQVPGPTPVIGHASWSAWSPDDDVPSNTAFASLLRGQGHRPLFGPSAGRDTAGGLKKTLLIECAWRTIFRPAIGMRPEHKPRIVVVLRHAHQGRVASFGQEISESSRHRLP